MSNRSKGQRRERQARHILEDEGYHVDTRPDVMYQNTDYFNKFDLLAMRADERPVFIQVKANGARGIRETVEWVQENVPLEHVKVEYWVCHDSEGWRILELTSGGSSTVFDERDMDVNMGEGVSEYLNSRDTDAQTG